MYQVAPNCLTWLLSSGNSLVANENEKNNVNWSALEQNSLGNKKNKKDDDDDESNESDESKENDSSSSENSKSKKKGKKSKKKN